MNIERMLATCSLLLLIGCGGCGESPTGGDAGPGDPPEGRGTIHVDATQRFQVMTGWEAKAQVGETECTGYQQYQAELFRRTANELGINRLNVPVRAGAENPRDWFGEFLSGQISRNMWTGNSYAAVNDNADPGSIDPNGFHFTELDTKIDRIVLPLRQELEARGERLYFMLAYLDHGPSAWEHATAPQEYAEFLLAAFQHMQSKYGFVPDAIEVVNEPDNSSVTFTPAQLGPAVAAAGQRLRAAGFDPVFVSPSTASMSRAVAYFDGMAQTAGALQYVREISYHRYGAGSVADLQAIAGRARQHDIKSSMLEHIDSGHEDLYEDLTIGQVSAWEQFGLAFCETDGDDSGNHYYWFDNADPSRVHITRIARHLAQYFRYVRLGAQRIGATSSSANLEPVAFENTNGRQVVVVNASVAESFTVSGLQAGTYGITYATAGGDGAHADVVLASGRNLSASIPAKGVIAIFRK
jgi:O-glycosyl hydrolase